MNRIDPVSADNNLERDASLSLNQRIRRDIERRVHSGEWLPGDRIPGEHALMADYGCSRMTVNKALSMLAEAGLIERRRRAGSFVARRSPHIEQVALSIPDIAHEVQARGHDYGYRLLSREIRATDAENAKERELGADGELLALGCLHLADDKPLALETRVIDLVSVPEARSQDFGQEPPGGWLLRYVPWTRAQHRIGAIGADRWQAGVLNVSTGTPCLSIDRHTWRGHLPVTYVRQLFLGEAYDLVARFAPGMGSGWAQP